MLNTIVAEALKEAADKLEKAGDFDMAVHDLIKETLSAHRRIIFNGNGYADEWVVEAEQRGLPNIRSMVDAIPALTTDCLLYTSVPVVKKSYSTLLSLDAQIRFLMGRPMRLAK